MPSGDFPNPVPWRARIAGHACVSVLHGLRALPVPASRALLLPGLGLYPALRSAHARRIRACFAASPFAESLTLEGYYRRRLDLLLGGLRLHGAPVPGETVRLHGHQEYREALASGRPLALLGLHAGLLELLHRVPEAPAGRPFHILTAPAFSPPLTAFMAAGRESEGKKILWAGIHRDGERSLAHGIRAVAAAGGVLALMADQNPDPGGEADGILRLWGRIRVPYPARLLLHLAGRGFACMPVSTRMGCDGVSDFRFHPAWTLPPAGGEDLGKALQAKVGDFLEEAIAAAPDQWNWSYPGVSPA